MDAIDYLSGAPTEDFNHKTVPTVADITALWDRIVDYTGKGHMVQGGTP